MLAVLGAIFLTIVAIVVIYWVVGFTMMTFAFADIGAAAKATWLILATGVVISVCLVWYLFVGTHIEVNLN